MEDYSADDYDATCEYVVDYIVAEHKKGKNMQYLVKWKVSRLRAKDKLSPVPYMLYSNMLAVHHNLGCHHAYADVSDFVKRHMHHTVLACGSACDSISSPSAILEPVELSALCFCHPPCPCCDAICFAFQGYQLDVNDWTPRENLEKVEALTVWLDRNKPSQSPNKV